MYTIRVTAHDKKTLPKKMQRVSQRHKHLGYLDGLIHAKDDIIREFEYDYEMISYWGTPEEVAKINYQSNFQSDFQSDVEEIIYGTDILEKAVGALWDLLEENNLTIDQFRQEILNALQDEDAIRCIIDVLISWSDRLY